MVVLRREHAEVWGRVPQHEGLSAWVRVQPAQIVIGSVVVLAGLEGMRVWVEAVRAQGMEGREEKEEAGKREDVAEEEEVEEEEKMEAEEEEEEMKSEAR